MSLVAQSTVCVRRCCLGVALRGLMIVAVEGVL